MGKSLLTLGVAMRFIQSQNNWSAQDTAALKDTLLPLHRELSDDLDRVMSGQLIKGWMQGTVRVYCY